MILSKSLMALWFLSRSSPENAEKKKIRKIACFYQDDSYGLDGLTVFQRFGKIPIVGIKRIPCIRLQRCVRWESEFIA